MTTTTTTIRIPFNARPSPHHPGMVDFFLEGERAQPSMGSELACSVAMGLRLALGSLWFLARAIILSRRAMAGAASARCALCELGEDCSPANAYGRGMVDAMDAIHGVRYGDLCDRHLGTIEPMIRAEADREAAVSLAVFS